MKNKKQGTSSYDNSFKAYCHYCGSTVGQISDRTENRVNAAYDCPKCMVTYCDQCSYEKDIDGRLEQLCLRCDSQMEKIM